MNDIFLMTAKKGLKSKMKEIDKNTDQFFDTMFAAPNQKYPQNRKAQLTTFSDNSYSTNQIRQQEYGFTNAVNDIGSNISSFFSSNQTPTNTRRSAPAPRGAGLTTFDHIPTRDSASQEPGIIDRISTTFRETFNIQETQPTRQSAPSAPILRPTLTTFDNHQPSTYSKIQDYLGKILKEEESYWYSSDAAPDYTEQFGYSTKLPVDVKNLFSGMTKSVDSMYGKDKPKTWQVTSALEVFTRDYYEAVKRLEKYHKDSNNEKPDEYFNFLIAITNNCLDISICGKEFSSNFQYTHQVEKLKLGDPNKLFGLGDLNENLSNLAHYVISLMVEKIKIDCGHAMDKIFDKRWYEINPVDTPMAVVQHTILDYAEDSSGLRPMLQTQFINELQRSMVVCYISNLYLKCPSFKNFDDVRNRMIYDVDLQKAYIKLFHVRFRIATGALKSYHKSMEIPIH